LASLALYFEWVPSGLSVAQEGLRLAAILLIVGAALSGLARWRPGWVAAWHGRAGLLRSIGAVVVGLWLGISLPLPVRPAAPIQLTIKALGTRDSNALGSEVWLYVESDGQRVQSRDFILEGAWTSRDGLEVSTPPLQPSILKWHGRGQSVRLGFVAHPWSGKVNVVANGQTRDIDLYRPPGKAETLVLNLRGGEDDPRGLGWPRRSPMEWFVFALQSVVLGGVVVALMDAFSEKVRFWSPQTSTLVREVWLYASIIAGACAIYWVLFYPASMTSDSLDQWWQAQTGTINDWHPPLYTFIELAVRKLWNSPAAMALLQLATFAGAAGLLIGIGRTATGAPKWCGILGATLCGFFPVVGLDSITLWKDIPYTASVLALVAITVAVIVSRLPLFDRKGWVAFGVVAIVACYSLRHNGLTVVMGAWGLALWLASSRLRISVIFATALLMAWAVNGPLMRGIGVQTGHPSVSITAHHIAAHLAAGEVPTGASDRRMLASLMGGTLAWPYDCSYGGATIFDPRFVNQIVDYRRLAHIAVELALSYPGTEVRHTLCVSSLVWRWSRGATEPIYLSPPQVYMVDGTVRWISPNPFGLREARTLGRFGERARRMVVHLIAHEPLRRPAPFLYVLLFASAVAWRRMKDPRMGVVVSVMALAQSSALMLLNVAQDPRYQLPIVVMALALAPMMLFAARVRVASDIP
jgi:hypothetical protein